MDLDHRFPNRGFFGDRQARAMQFVRQENDVGTGIDIHEEPRLNQKCADVMEPGHVVTVEPGIYLPGVGGVRIENSCVITQTGARPLVTSPRELRIL